MTPFSADPRFEEKVAIGSAEECWPWLAATDSNGYGVFALPRNGGRSVAVRAHRYGLSLVTGNPVPTELDVDHLCRNRACCNPTHLEAVTHAENMRRSPHQRVPGMSAPCGDWQKAKTHCPQDHPYDETNTGHKPNGHRYCRACARERMRARTARSNQEGTAA